MLIFLATLAQFILGGLWYSPLMFGKWWMQIMEVTHLGKDELAKMQKEMAPFYVLQFILTFVVTMSLAGTYEVFKQSTPDCNIFAMAFGIWMGFIAPIQISTVIWGNTKKKYWAKQLFVMLSMQLVGIMLAAAILSY
jgi:spore maturation protein SpmB